jgi:hypothetical protein
MTNKERDAITKRADSAEGRYILAKEKLDSKFKFIVQLRVLLYDEALRRMSAYVARCYDQQRKEIEMEHLTTEESM